jgi:hypothetical protein
MFRRKVKDGEADKLRSGIEPNTLSWEVEDVVPPAADVPADDADEEGDEDGESLADELAREMSGDAQEGEDDPRTARERAAALQAELQREAEEFGLTGSNAVALYGPNGEDVASLIDSLADIDDATAEAIADAYEAIPEAERKVAQSVVRRRHRGGGLEAELWAAEHAVSDWLAAMQLSDEELDLYSIVAAAATDAVDALVLEDDLDDVDFNTLYGAWSDVMDEDEEEGDEGDGDDADEGEAVAGEPAAAAASVEADVEADAETGEPEAEDGEFGPNTELVMSFLTRLASLSAAEISELVTEWREQPKEELRIAHRNLQNVADEEAKWRNQLHLAQEEVFAWMAGQILTLDYSWGGASTMGRAREVAGPCVADAIAALVMADILEPEDADILYAPWAAVIREPELPVYEDDESDDADADSDARP